MYGFKILFFIEYICSLTILYKHVVHCISLNLMPNLSRLFVLPDISLIFEIETSVTYTLTN